MQWNLTQFVSKEYKEWCTKKPHPQKRYFWLHTSFWDIFGCTSAFESKLFSGSQALQILCETVDLESVRAHQVSKISIFTLEVRSITFQYIHAVTTGWHFYLKDVCCRAFLPVLPPKDQVPPRTSLWYLELRTFLVLLHNDSERFLRMTLGNM